MRIAGVAHDGFDDDPAVIDREIVLLGRDRLLPRFSSRGRLLGQRLEDARDQRCFLAISAQVPVGSISRYLRQQGRARDASPACS